MYYLAHGRKALLTLALDRGLPKGKLFLVHRGMAISLQRRAWKTEET